MYEAIRKLSSLADIDTKEALDSSKWLDYTQLGITIDDSEALQALICDDEAYETYMPMHAWRALHQVNPSEETVLFLLSCFKKPHLEDNFFLCNDVLELFRNLRTIAIALMSDYISENIHLADTGFIIEALYVIGRKHPEYKQQCIDICSKNFKNYKQAHAEVNAGLFQGLVELNAYMPHLKLIRAATKANKINYNYVDISELNMEILLEITPEEAAMLPTFIPDPNDEFSPSKN
jgi:hypothetical protein